MALSSLGIYGQGKDLCIISYGNGYYLSRQAEKILAEKGVALKIIDLRWLAPLDEQAILAEITGYKNILIVDECRRTGSISEALSTVIVEAKQGQTDMPRVERITAEDCFIPLGSASYAVLPSCEQIVTKVQQMLAAPEASGSVTPFQQQTG
jgi:2-oxoisovalerate dehydrogenase E1 component